MMLHDDHFVTSLAHPGESVSESVVACYVSPSVLAASVYSSSCNDSLRIPSIASPSVASAVFC